ncbi:MAG: hypothetical protein OIN66_02870 [Candidatus Methanoperedens sp.]|nr:hypothetical protein [Candidatus Methanoperedens sp.]
MPSSAVLMTKVVFLFIFLIVWGQVASAQSTATTIFTLDVHKNGNASWTVEKRLLLTTSELNEWEGLIKKGQNISRYQTEIRADIDGLLSSAQMNTNRSMKLENFNISYDTVRTVSGGSAIILYSFEWENFSRIDSGNISIGDVFSGTVISSDNTLIIKIPDGFEVQSVSPGFDRRDKNSLIWDSTTYHSFAKGEPSLVLSPVTVDNRDKEPQSNIIVPALVLVSGIILVVLLKRMRSGGGKNKDKSAADDAGGAMTGYTEANAVQIENATDMQTDAAGINNIQANDTEADTAQSAGNAEVEMPQLPDMPDEFLGDEEMIEQYLIKCGGQAYQSDIVKDSGLSKSKISIVLAKMKDDGRILKIRKGKENIIRLAVKK